MNRKELRNAYKGFFVDSKAGQEFMNTITQMKTDNLDQVMSLGEISHANRALGNKEVIDHIQSVLGFTKKGDKPA